MPLVRVSNGGTKEFTIRYTYSTSANNSAGVTQHLSGSFKIKDTANMVVKSWTKVSGTTPTYSKSGTPYTHTWSVADIKASGGSGSISFVLDITFEVV